MSKLLRVELSKKINLAIPAFHNYQEIKTLNAPLITNGLNEFVQFRLPSWKINKNSIERLYEFENFKKAFGFMTEVAHVAEYIDHHPEWSNVYNKINVRLLSHYCNGVTLKDLFLAFSMVNY